MLTRTLAIAALSLALLSGCGDAAAPTYDAAADGSTYDAERQHSEFDLGDPEWVNAEIDLPDGRTVSMYYAKNKGLAEQHYSPDADAWTAPRIIYQTDTDPCQGITLEEQDGTVAVIADWNGYCYDGEPPNESIAGVATGDLNHWDTDLTKGFDGWSLVTLYDGGSKAVWSHHSDRLTWTDGDGFDKQLGGD